MRDMGIERFGRFGDRRFGRQRITKPSIKALISMTEIDTGIQLSLQERKEMSLSILAKIEDANQ
jgi:hypothetical protein